MILDYIFEKDLDHRIYDLCREKKSLFVVFFLFAEKLHAFAFFSLSLECEIFDSILKCKVYESFHFLQFFFCCSFVGRCWTACNTLFTCCCFVFCCFDVYLFLFLFILDIVIHIILFFSFNILRIVTIWYENKMQR